VAGLNGNETIALMPYAGTMNAKLFNQWFAGMLCPELQTGSVIIMDNAPFHIKKKLYAIAKAKGMVLLFLPPYSPDKNPIEHLWANIKRYLKIHIEKYPNLLSAIYGYFKTD